MAVQPCRSLLFRMEENLFAGLGVIETTYYQKWQSVIGDFHALNLGPFILSLMISFSLRLDEHGQLSRFIHNNHVRDSLMTVSPERAIELYDAYVTIGKMMRDPANQIEYKMVPGDMVTFNNYRVMHGRTGFTVTDEGSRFLCGIYMDWDIMYSRLRALAKKLNVPSPC